MSLDEITCKINKITVNRGDVVVLKPATALSYADAVPQCLIVVNHDGKLIAINHDGSLDVLDEGAMKARGWVRAGTSIDESILSYNTGYAEGLAKADRIDRRQSMGIWKKGYADGMGRVLSITIGLASLAAVALALRWLPV